jgi:hypothetical protein
MVAIKHPINPYIIKIDIKGRKESKGNVVVPQKKGHVTHNRFRSTEIEIKISNVSQSVQYRTSGVLHKRDTE